MMTRDEIIKKFNSSDTDSFYGTMYGGEYVFMAALGGSKKRKDKAIKIGKNEVQFHPEKDCIVFIWGGPGPDFNVYKFSDYGKTWAFSMDEMNCELYG